MENKNITKAEALKKIEELEEYIKNLDSRELEMEKLFLELMNQGLTLKIDSNINEIDYYDKNNDLIVSLEFKTQVVWFNYYEFWSKFRLKFKLNHLQIKVFLNTMVEMHLNCKGFTTETGTLNITDW